MKNLCVIFQFFLIACSCHAGVLGSYRGNILGNASTRTFVHIERDVFNADFGDGNVKFRLVFSSNPQKEPGILGAFWSIGLLDSAVAYVNQRTIEWKAPNGVSFFFNKDRSSESGHSRGELYAYNSGEFTAQTGKAGDVVIQSGREKGVFYEYKGGRLACFCAAAGADTFSINYTSAGNAVSIVNASKNTTAAEFTYKTGVKECLALKIGNDVFEFGYAKSPLIGPDGRKRYGDHGVGLLTSLKKPDGTEERFAYSNTEARTRTVILKDFREATTPPVLVSRMDVLDEDGKSKGFIEWCTATGMIMADDGGTYKVGNGIFDKYYVERRAKMKDPKEGGRTIPVISALEYKRKDRPHPDRFYYDWISSFEIRTNGLTGETMKTSFVGANGPSYLKVRKIERLEGKDVSPGNAVWTAIRVNNYDNEGRLIREVDEAENVKDWKYTRLSNGNFLVEKTLNGCPAGYEQYSGNKRIEGGIYTDEGKLEVYKYLYGSANGKNVMEKYADGAFVFRKIYGEAWNNSRVEYHQSGDGREFFYRYLPDGTVMTLSKAPNGHEMLRFYNEKLGKYVDTNDLDAITAFKSDNLPHNTKESL